MTVISNTDVIDDVIRYEAGSMDSRETLKFFSKLSVQVWRGICRARMERPLRNLLSVAGLHRMV